MKNIIFINGYNNYYNRKVKYSKDLNDYLDNYEFIVYDEETEEQYSVAELHGYDNYIDYVYNEVDWRAATEIIDRFDLLKFDEMCKELAKWDGYGQSLSFYDGNELELEGGFFAYLVN